MDDLDLRRAPETASQRLAGVPRTFDPETGVVDLVASTDAPVRVLPLFGPERLESLRHDPASVDMSRVNSGRMPVLVDHANSVGAVVGRVLSGRIENGKLVLTARIDRSDIKERVARGNLPNVSIGYRPLKGRQTRAATKTAPAEISIESWEPVEVSLVAVPADAGAHVRSFNPPGGGDPMALENDAGTTPANRGLHLAAVSDDPAQIRRDVAEIARLCRKHDIPDSVSNQLIEAGDLLAAREAIADIREQRDARTASTRGELDGHGGVIESRGLYDASEPNGLRLARVDGLVARMMGTPAEGRARDYQGVPLAGLARECLADAGEPHAYRLSDSRAVTMALQTRATAGLGTTSNYTSVLVDAVNVTAAREFQTLRNPLLQAGRRRNFTDFRLQHHVSLSEAPGLVKLGEHGEVQFGYFRDSGESWRGATYARRTGVTREVLVNDNTSLLAEIPRKFASDAAALEGDLVGALLAENSAAGPTMADGDPVFHSNHSNLSGNAAVIGMSGLSEAVIAIRTQTGPNGRKIQGTPRYLVVPAAQEFLARQALTNVAATEVANVNPMSALLELIIEPRLDDLSTLSWYVVANDLDGLVWGTLEGFNAPVIESQVGFEIEGIQWKVRHDFGCGFVGYRGWYKNPGSSGG